MARLAARLAMFSARNPGVCATIDPFGRLDSRAGCGSGTGEGCPDSVTAVARALVFLERNRDFFYLPSGLPAVRTTTRVAETRWRVEFEPRREEGYTVEGDRIIIEVHTEVDRIRRGLYPPVRVPRSPTLAPADAPALVPSFDGFLCYTWIGVSLDGEPTLQVIPWIVGTPWDPIRLEFRLAYRFLYSEREGSPMFERCLDAVTGEDLYGRPLIYC